jgi:hypothetical protein
MMTTPIKHQYEYDVKAALKTVEEKCGDDVSNLLAQIIASQASLIASKDLLIKRLLRDNVSLQEKAGAAFFNTITYRPPTLPGETVHNSAHDIKPEITYQSDEWAKSR